MVLAKGGGPMSDVRFVDIVEKAGGVKIDDEDSEMECKIVSKEYGPTIAEEGGVIKIICGNGAACVTCQFEIIKTDGTWKLDAQDTKGLTVSKYDHRQIALFFKIMHNISEAISELLSS